MQTRTQHIQLQKSQPTTETFFTNFFKFKIIKNTQNLHKESHFSPSWFSCILDDKYCIALNDRWIQTSRVLNEKITRIYNLLVNIASVLFVICVNISVLAIVMYIQLLQLAFKDASSTEEFWDIVTLGLGK